MKLDYFALTCPGGREVNEDSWGAFVNDNGELCFVVADGLGGHGFGDLASQKAVSVFEEVFDGCESDAPEEFIDAAFAKAQDEILNMQKERHNKQGMKTTCVALCVFQDKIRWGHIGDSRLYAFKKNKIVFQTTDHSVPQLLVMAKEIKPRQIRHHPDRNKLLKVLGIPWEEKQFQISQEFKPDDFDAFLLCSDGFWELIDEKSMRKHLKKSVSAQNWVERMACEVNENGANEEMDNYTVIAVILNKE